MNILDIVDAAFSAKFLVWIVPLLTACLTLATCFLAPIGRALAVVLLSRYVPKDIAKMAIPFVLRPTRPSLFNIGRQQKGTTQNGVASQEKNQ